MLRRLRLYFVGFGIGLLMVYVMFFRNQDRDMDIWTPSQRVLEEIRLDSLLQNGSKIACYQECLNLDSNQMKALWTDSKVKSLNPGGNPYKYLITLKTDEQHLEAELTKPDERKESPYQVSYIKSYSNPISCDCADE